MKTDNASSRKRIPLTLTIEKDVASNFQSIGAYEVEGALLRTAAINCRLVDNSFEVELWGSPYINRRKPMRAVDPVVISLNPDSLLVIVQRCRDEWQKAIEHSFVKTSPETGRKRNFSFEENWKLPVDEKAFSAIAGRLALAGEALFNSVFDRDSGEELVQELRAIARSGKCVFTVDAPDFHLGDAQQLSLHGGTLGEMV